MRLGQLVDELHEARHLEGRHPGARPFGVISRPCPFPRSLRSTITAFTVSPRSRRARDHAGFLDVGMGVEHCFDFGRPDLEARGVDHALNRSVMKK